MPTLIPLGVVMAVIIFWALYRWKKKRAKNAEIAPEENEPKKQQQTEGDCTYRPDNFYNLVVKEEIPKNINIYLYNVIIIYKYCIKERFLGTIHFLVR